MFSFDIWKKTVVGANNKLTRVAWLSQKRHRREQPSDAGSSVFFNMSHDVPSANEVQLLRATAAAVFGSGPSPAQWIIEPVVERRVESLQPTGFFEAVIQIAANRDDDG